MSKEHGDNYFCDIIEKKLNNRCNPRFVFSPLNSAINPPVSLQTCHFIEKIANTRSSIQLHDYDPYDYDPAVSCSALFLSV